MHQVINNYYDDKIPLTYLIDTFDGIDVHYLNERELSRLSPSNRSLQGLESYKASSFEEVSSRFKKFKNVTLIKGSIPDVFESLEFLDKVSFLHIDLNNAFPEVAALKYFYNKMTSPGFILLDDYGFVLFGEHKRAFDIASEEMGVSISISLPSRQGLMIRI